MVSGGDSARQCPLSEQHVGAWQRQADGVWLDVQLVINLRQGLIVGSRVRYY